MRGNELNWQKVLAERTSRISDMCIVFHKLCTDLLKELPLNYPLYFVQLSWDPFSPSFPTPFSCKFV